MFVAAGNSGQDIDSLLLQQTIAPTVRTSTHTAAVTIPGASVAAIDRNGAHNVISNYGAKNVDLGAPGEHLLNHAE